MEIGIATLALHAEACDGCDGHRYRHWRDGNPLDSLAPCAGFCIDRYIVPLDGIWDATGRGRGY